MQWIVRRADEVRARQRTFLHELPFLPPSRLSHDARTRKFLCMTDEQPTSGGGRGGGGGRLKSLSILWAVLIGIGLIALGGSILLPSTKRARVNVEEIRRLSEERAAA